MIRWSRSSRRFTRTGRRPRRGQRLVWEALEPRLLLSADAGILTALDDANVDAPPVPMIESAIPITEASGASDDTLDTARALALVPGETLEIVAAIGDGVFGQTDVDLYRIQVATGGTLTADVDAREFVEHSVDSVVRVFDAAGIEIAVNDDGTAPDDPQTSFGDSFLRLMVDAGTYFVGVSGAANVAYSPSVGGSGPPPLPEPLDPRLGRVGGYRLGLDFVPFENPSNDTRATATAVPLEPGGAVQISGLIGNNRFGAKDVDFYRIDVPTGTTLAIDHLGSPYTRLLVFDDTLTDHRISVPSGWHTSVPLLAGSHFIGVSYVSNGVYLPDIANSGSVDSFATDATYVFDLRLVPFEAPPNDTLDTPTVLVLQPNVSRDVAGTIGDNVYGSGDVDLYQFDLDAGAVLSLSVDGPGFTKALRVFDETGAALVLGPTAPGTSGVGSPREIRLLAGRYAVGVAASGNIGYSPTVASPPTGFGVSSSGDYVLHLLVSPFEHSTDDTLDTATDPHLVPGVLLETEGRIGDNDFDARDVDFYQFDLAAGATLTVEVDTSGIGSPLDAIARLFSADGLDLGLFPGVESARTRDLGAGQYVVGVSSASNVTYAPQVAGSGTAPGSTIGRYVLRMRLVPLDDTLETANVLDLQPGVALERLDTIGDSPFDANDVDLYRFDLATPGTLTLDIDAHELASPLDSVLRLFDMTGVEIARNEDGTDPETGFGGRDPAMRRVLGAGRYFVGVSSAPNVAYHPSTANSGTSAESEASSGDYLLRLRFVIETPADGTLDTARVLDVEPDLAREAEGVIGDSPSGPNDVDLYRVDLDTGALVTFDVDAQALGSPLNALLRVFDDNGVEVARNDDAMVRPAMPPTPDPALTLALEAGRYFVGVSSSLNSTYSPTGAAPPPPASGGLASGSDRGSYVLRASVVSFEAATNDTLDTASIVDLQPNVSRELDGAIGDNAFGARDVDLYHLDLTAGGLVTLDIDAETLGSALDSVLRVFDAAGLEVARNDNPMPAGGGGLPSLDALLAVSLGPGQYFVGVSSFSNSTYLPNVAGGGAPSPTDTPGSYRLHVLLTPFEAATNDTLDTASELDTPPGVVVDRSAAIGDNAFGARDVDLYRLDLDVSGTLTVDVDAQALGSPLNGVLRVFGATGVELARNDDEMLLPGSSGSPPPPTVDPAVRIALFPGRYFVGVSGVANPFYSPMVPSDGAPGGAPVGSELGTYRLRSTFVAFPDADDDTLATAGVFDLRLGVPADVSGTIGDSPAGANDVDLYRIELATGALLRLDVDAEAIGSPLNSLLRIFDETGVELARNDDGPPLPGASAINRDSVLGRALGPGVYVVGVSSASNAFYSPFERTATVSPAGVATGSYVLTAQLSAFEAPTDDTLETARVLDVQPGVPLVVGRSLGNNTFGPGDVDLYRIDLAIDGKLDVDIDTQGLVLDGDLDSVLRIFNEAGDEIARNDDEVPSAGGGSPSRDAALRQNRVAGIYYVGVSAAPNSSYSPHVAGSGLAGLPPASGSTGAYLLRLVFSPFESPGNDTLATAAVLDLANGALSVPGVIGDSPFDASDVDLYRVHLDRGGLLRAEARRFGSPLDSALRVFDAMGREIAVNDNPVPGVPTARDALLATPLTPGHYFIGVSSAPNVTYQPGLAGSGAGTTTGSYVLQLSLLPFEESENDMLATATALELHPDAPLEVTGFIGNTPSGASDVDLYRIGLTAGAFLSVDVDAQVLGSTLNSVLRVFTTSGFEVGRNDDPAPAPGAGGASTLDASLVVSLSAGEYFVGVSSASNTFYGPTTAAGGVSTGAVPLTGTGSYTLRMLAVGFESPDNNSFETATPIQPEPNVPLEIPAIIGDSPFGAGDDDLYRLDLEVGALVTLDVDAQALGSPLDSVLHVIDERGLGVAINDDAVPPAAPSSGPGLDPALGIALVPGRYFVAVSGSPNASATMGTYVLRVLVTPFPDPGDETLGTAGLLDVQPTVPREVSGTIGDSAFGANDVDLYRVDLAVDGLLIADIDAEVIGSDLDSVLRVFDESGQAVASNFDETPWGDSDDSFVGVPLSAGRYFVGVSNESNPSYSPFQAVPASAPPTGNLIGEYRLRVLVVPLESSADDTFASANVVALQPGAPVQRTGVIGDTSAGANDVDLYRIDVAVTGLLDVGVEARTLGVPLRAIVRLFHPSGIVEPIISGTDTPDPASRYRLFPGRYFVGVSGMDNVFYAPLIAGSASGGWSTGNYRLNLLFTPFEEGTDDTLATARRLDPKLSVPLEVAGAIADNAFGPRDVDLYRLDLATGAFLLADVDTETIGTGLNSALRVFDDRGVQRAFSDDDVLVAGSPQRDPVAGVSLGPGRYFVGVSGSPNLAYSPSRAGSGISWQADGTGNYLLRVLLVPLEDPTNDTIVTASVHALAPNSPFEVDGRIGDNPFGGNDVDLYGVALTSSGILTLDVDAHEQGSPLNSAVRLFDAGGREIARNDDGRDPDTGVFGLDPALTAQVGAGSYFVGVSGTPNFDYSPHVANSGPATPAGPGSYRLRLRFATPAATDSGDTLDTASGIDLQPNVRLDRLGTIGDGDFGAQDVDLYRFEVAASGVLTLDVDAREIGSPLDSVLRLFTAVGLELRRNDDGTDPDTGFRGADAVVSVYLDPGAYVVGVSGFPDFAYVPASAGSGARGSTGSYLLRLLFAPQPPAGPADDTIDAAIPLDLRPGLPLEALGAIGDSDLGADDVDLYRFDLDASGRLTFDVDAREIGSALDSGLRVFDHEGKLLSANDDGVDPDTGFRGRDSVVTLQLGPGRYYVGVSSFPNLAYAPTTAGSGSGTTIGPYVLRALLTSLGTGVAGDDTLASAMVLDVQPGIAVERTGAIGGADEPAGPSDVDFYALDLTAGQTLAVDIDARELGSSLDSLLRLFDADGRPLARNDDAVDPRTGRPSLDSALTQLVGRSGRYYVGVSSFANAAYDPQVAGSGVGHTSGDYVLRVGVTAPTAPPVVTRQVVHLDFDGAAGTFVGDVPPFDATAFGLDAAARDALVEMIHGFVLDDFVRSGPFDDPDTPVDLPVDIVLEPPAPAPFSTVFVGGALGLRFGRAERIDAGNTNFADTAAVFTDHIAASLGPGLTIEQAARAVADTISHELGHLFGLEHVHEDGLLMQPGELDRERTDDERFGTGTLFHRLGTQDDVALLRANLRPRDAGADDSPDTAIPLLLDAGAPLQRTYAIDGADDFDVFRLSGLAGQLLNVQVTAQLLGSALDAILELLNAQAEVIARGDNGAALAGRLTLDPALRVTLPADGDYFVRVGGEVLPSSTTSGGVYALEVTLEDPDPASASREVAAAVEPKDTVVLDRTQRRHEFTEADGDRVRLIYSGTGSARVLFDAGEIELIDVAGGGGSLTVQVVAGDGNGRAAIGTIQGSRFGTVSVNADLGYLFVSAGARQIHIRGGDFGGAAVIEGRVDRLVVDGDVTGSIRIDRDVTMLMAGGVSRTGRLDVQGSVGRVRVAGSLDGTVTVGRDLHTLSVGADLLGEVRANRNIGTLRATNIGSGAAPAALDVLGTITAGRDIGAIVARGGIAHDIEAGRTIGLIETNRSALFDGRSHSGRGVGDLSGRVSAGRDIGRLAIGGGIAGRIAAAQRITFVVTDDTLVGDEIFEGGGMLEALLVGEIRDGQ